MVRTITLFLLFISFIILLTSISGAKVLDFYIKPENPVKGDKVTIYGTADPNEEVRIDITFEKIVPVKDGKYIFSIERIDIPISKNKFTVTVYGCTDLFVSARRVIIGDIYTPWITMSSKATNGIATISQSVPTGTYDVKIHGRSNQDTVKIKIVATGYVKADKEGKFSYSYDTNPIPPGKFIISVDGISKTVTLYSSQSSSSTGSISASPSTSQSSLSVTSTPSPMPTQAPLPIPTLTPTPKPTPIYTPQPTITSTLKPTPTSTPTATSTPVMSHKPIPTTPTLKPTPKSWWKIPGFELIYAIIVLLAVAYIFRKRY